MTSVLKKTILAEALHEASERGDFAFPIPRDTVPIKSGCVIGQSKRLVAI